jgi:hypothetical protein
MRQLSVAKSPAFSRGSALYYNGAKLSGGVFVSSRKKKTAVVNPLSKSFLTPVARSTLAIKPTISSRKMLYSDARAPQGPKLIKIQRAHYLVVFSSQ